MMKQKQSFMSSESNASDQEATTSLQKSPKQIDPSLSPVTRRKHEFRLARLQSEVMTRARSTLFGLGESWKSKMNGAPATPTSLGPPSTINTPPRSPKNQNAVKNTFEFFFPKKNKETSGMKMRKGNSENNLAVSQKSSSINNSKRNSERPLKLHKNESKTDSKSNNNNNNKSSKHDDRSRRFSRNQSIDISETYQQNRNNKKNSSEMLSRSFDDGIHYLSEEYENFLPRSYNDTFSFLDDFDNQTRSIYDEDVTTKRKSTNNNKKNPEKTVTSPQTRHILFNDEDDVIFFKSSSCPDKSGKKSERHNYYDQVPIVKPLPNSKDIPGILHTRGNSNNSNKSQDSLNYHSGSSQKANQHAEKIISARLKIQPPTSGSSNSTSSDPTRNIQNKVLSFPKNDQIRYENQDRNFYQDVKQNTTNAHRNISTVIIEEQERVIGSVNESRTNMSNNNKNEGSQISSTRDSIKLFKKQPSFDYEHGHASTLPRASTTNSYKNKSNQTNAQPKRDTDLPDNGDEKRAQRCNSLDLELESQAMKIVRTVGQAFEVCHKLSLENNSYTDDRSDQSVSEHERCSPEPLSDLDEIKKETTPIASEPLLIRPNHLDIIPTTHFNFSTPPKKVDTGDNNDKTPDTPNTREMQQLREQLEQQSLQTRQALAQLMLVREQLLTETNARIEAQARTQQLLQQNRELLEHIAAMGGYQDADRPGSGITPGNIGLAPQPSFSTLSLGSPGASGLTNISPFSTLNKQFHSNLATINMQNTLASINQMQNYNQKLNQQELYNLNQDLLNKLQNLSLLGQLNPDFSSANANPMTQNPNLYPYIYSNQQTFGSQNSSPSGGTLTPLGNQSSANRKQQGMSSSPNSNKLGLSLDESLDNLTATTIQNTSPNNNSSKYNQESPQFIRPLSQIGTMTTVNYDGKVKVIVPVTESDENSNRVDYQRQERKQNTIPGIVTTDERGTLKRMASAGSSCGSATPSFITRSSSEKVPSRSQMMTEMQRTQWARHTTK